MFTHNELEVMQDALTKYEGKWSHNPDALNEDMHKEQHEESLRIRDALLNRVEELLYDHFYATHGFTCIEHNDFGKEKCKVQCPYCEKI